MEVKRIDLYYPTLPTVVLTWNITHHIEETTEIQDTAELNSEEISGFKAGKVSRGGQIFWLTDKIVDKIVT